MNYYKISQYLIGIFILLVIILNLLHIYNSISKEVVMGLLTALLIAIVFFVGIGVAYAGLKAAGEMEDDN